MSKVFYESVTTNWSSSPKSGKVHGTRNIVRIKNGKGVKTKEALKEEKLQRKEEEKRRFNGNNRDFLASVGVNEVMSSQNRRKAGRSSMRSGSTMTAA